MKKVVIVGGGITGLAAAHHLQTKAKGKLQYCLVESAPRLGGKIQSLKEQGFTIEAGPDSFMVKKSPLLDLCRALGLDSEIIGAKQAGVFVFNESRLDPIPEGVTMMAPTKILPFLQSRLISWPGKMRMGVEAFVPRRAADGDESLGSFVRRRLGREALDKIAGPLLAGIHNTDPDKLSLQSTFPMFLEMERKYGSLMRGFRTQRQAASPRQAQRQPASPFLSLRGGMQSLVDAFAAQLPAQSIFLNTGISSVSRARSANAYSVALNDGTRLYAEAILFATPAYVTADLLNGLDPSLAEKLRGISYSSTANVSLAFKREDIQQPLKGTGFLVPAKENRAMTACTWSSIKFEGRAPDGYVLMRLFLGGSHSADWKSLDDRALTKLALEDLRGMMKIGAAAPVLAKVFRWINGAPQYEVGHACRIGEMERRVAAHRGLLLAGAAYHGGSVPDCVRSGVEQAEKILNYLDRELGAESLVASQDWSQA